MARVKLYYCEGIMLTRNYVCLFVWVCWFSVKNAHNMEVYFLCLHNIYIFTKPHMINQTESNLRDLVPPVPCMGSSQNKKQHIWV